MTEADEKTTLKGASRMRFIHFNFVLIYFSFKIVYKITKKKS